MIFFCAILKFLSYGGDAAPMGGMGGEASHQLKKEVLNALQRGKYKIDHISKTENHTKKTQEYKNSNQNIAHLLR